VGSATLLVPISRPLRPKAHLDATRVHTASGGYLGQGSGVWGREDVKPLSQRPSITNIGHIRRILGGQRCLQVHGTPPPLHTARSGILDLRQNRPVRTRILYVTDEPRTITRVEGFSHPLGHVLRYWVGSATLLVPISRPLRPKAHLDATRVHTASGGHLGQGSGVWGRKDVKPLSQRPSTTNIGHIPSILGGQRCLLVHCTPPPLHTARSGILDLSQNRPVRARISHVMAEPRTTTHVEGISHPLGTCTKVLGGVCNICNAEPCAREAILAIPCAHQDDSTAFGPKPKHAYTPSYGI